MSQLFSSGSFTQTGHKSTSITINTMAKFLNAVAVLAVLLPFTQAQSNFIDDCTTFNSNLYTKANWAAGLGSVLVSNVNPSGGGVLNFEIPAGTRNGGEIVSKAQYSYGQVEAQFKVPSLPGSYL